MKSFILTVIFLSQYLIVSAQTNLDSIYLIWQNKTMPDSVRVEAYKNYIMNGYLYSHPDTALIFADSLHVYARKHAYPRASAIGYLLQGIANWFQGDYTNALERYHKAIDVNEKIGNQKGLSSCLMGIGSIYKEQGNYPRALDYFQRSLAIDEKNNDEISIAGTLNNIGNIYKNQGEYSRALGHFQRSLAIKEKLGDKRGTASNLHNIGVVYDRQGNYVLALEYYHKARIINEESGNKQWLSNNLSNIGLIHQGQRKFPLAMEYFQKALSINKEIGNRESIASGLINLGALYRLQKKYNLAIEFCLQGRTMAADVGVLEWQKSACECLYNSYKEMGRDADALSFYEEMIVMKDSLYNKENTKKITRLEMQFDFDKKEAATLAHQAQRNALAAQELKRQKLLSNGFLGGFSFVAIFALVFFTQRNRIAKEKQYAEEQKQLVEVKNREILDSIEYAKRIQTAILPPTRIVKEFLKNSFILYLPKDIVAGDFYWMENLQMPNEINNELANERNSIDNELIYFAACDCTGHGVPGAMVSVVCNNALNRAVNEFGERMPGKIFEKARELVLENFAKSDEEVKDGMDASLCALNTQNRTLLWSGANNPLWILRNTEMIEYKADKYPIGKGYENKPFTTHEIILQEGDTIYLFTDGFADQFGGLKNKKLTKARFREFLLSISSQSMDQQHEALLKYHDEYRGDQEQVDDICVIGVKV